MDLTGTALLTCLACLVATSSAYLQPALPYPQRLSSDVTGQTVQAVTSALHDTYSGGVPDGAHSKVSGPSDIVRGSVSGLSGDLLGAGSRLAGDVSDKMQTSLAAAHFGAQEAHESAHARMTAAHLSAQEAHESAHASTTAAHSSAQEAHESAYSSIAAAHSSAQEAHESAHASIAAAHSSAQEAHESAYSSIAASHSSAQEAHESAHASIAAAHSSAQEAHESAYSSIAAAHSSAQEAQVNAQADIADALSSVREAQTRAQAAIIELAVFVSQSKFSSSTSYMMKNTRFTISRHFGPSKVKPPSIIVKDAAVSGMVCVPLDSIDASEVVSDSQSLAEREAQSGGQAVTGGETAAGGVKVTGSEQFGKLVGDELQKSVKPVQTIGQGQGIVVAVGGIGSTSVYGGQGTTASAGSGAAAASVGTAAGAATTSTEEGGTTASLGHARVTLSAGQKTSKFSGHKEFVSAQGEVITEHGEDSAISTVLDATRSVGTEASAIETSFSVGGYSGIRDAAVVSADGSSAHAGHVQTSSGRGASASSGGVSSSVGSGSASVAGSSASVGGSSATAGHASASPEAVSASAGGVLTSSGGGRATASSAHGAIASSSSGHSTSDTASSGHGASSASSGSRSRYSATLSGGKLFVSSPVSGGGGDESHLVTAGTRGEHGSATVAGEGYTLTSSSGSGSASAASVGSDGRVSLDVSGTHAQAAAIGAGGSVVHLSSDGGLTHLDPADCDCVLDYLCDEDGFINTSGAGVISIRSFSLGGGTSPLDTRCGAGRVRCCHKEQREPVGWTPLGCGTRSPVRLDRRVVSGEAARLGEFPWIVALKRVVPAGKVVRHEYLCGGSLIAPNVVLTGAHCVYKHRTERLVARVGEWDTNSADSVYPHQDLTVAEVVIHERFDAGKLWYDVALLRLETPAELAAHVNTICLPGEDDYHIDYSNCFANGWGQESFDEAVYPNLMKKVPLSKVDSGQCQSRMRETRLGNWFQLHETFLCAGGQPRVDTCQGDGGSPLVCRNTSPHQDQDEDTFVQIGIVAWGINCHRGGFPGVYADVVKLVPWIRSTLSTLSEDAPGLAY